MPFAFTGNEFRFAAGAPGGSRLITSVFQVAHDVLFGGAEADDAVVRPRIPGEQVRTVFVESAEAGSDELRALGNDVEVSARMSRLSAETAGGRCSPVPTRAATRVWLRLPDH